MILGQRISFIPVLAIACIALSMLGCSYRLVRVTDSEGGHHWSRFYADPQKRQAYQTRMIFKYQYSPIGQAKRYKPTGHDTIAGCSYYQFDTTRLYIEASLELYRPLFESGIISTRTFYCLKDDSCHVPDKSHAWNLSTGVPYVPGILGWKGHAVLISKIEQVVTPRTKMNARRFLLFTHDSFQNGFTVYVLELTNPEADKLTDLTTFCKGAELSFFKYAWTEI